MGRSTVRLSERTANDCGSPLVDVRRSVTSPFGAVDDVTLTSDARAVLGAAPRRSSMSQIQRPVECTHTSLYTYMFCDDQYGRSLSPRLCMVVCVDVCKSEDG